MLARIYHNPHNKDANQSRLQKILQFWASKEVYDPDTIYNLEGEMIAGPPGLPKDLSVATADAAGLQQQAPHSLNQWQLDKQRNPTLSSLDQDLQEKQIASATSASLFATSNSQQFLSNQLPGGMYPSVPPAPFGASLPVPSPMQSATQTPMPHLNQTPAVNIGEPPPPYPLFPPGLIPGMVRKMQIGSGVPYSPMSPLDIPTVIPPSIVSPSEILDRVSKFFKEIGEVNPSEGPMKPADSNDEEDEYEREPPVRKGGACIPTPSNLQQVDPDTGTFPDGSVERKPATEHQLSLLYECESCSKDAIITAREFDRSVVESDIDNDAVAKVFGRDGKGRVVGLGMGVSKTAIQYSTPYKRALEEEHDTNTNLQTEVKRLKKEIDEIKQVLSQNGVQHSSTCYGSSSQAQEGSPHQEVYLEWIDSVASLEEVMLQRTLSRIGYFINVIGKN
ncbi:hypothetical protein AAC387_Pa03g1235 [Persea americana]